MKKAFRSVLTFALALAMMVTCVGGTAFAASSASTIIDGHSATARIAETTANDGGAVATTRITGVTNAYAYAKATVYYKFDQDKCYTVADDQKTNGYAVATAYVKRVPGVVKGGQGNHTIFYNNITWNPSPTQFGDIWNDATEYK